MPLTCPDGPVTHCHSPEAEAVCGAERAKVGQLPRSCEPGGGKQKIAVISGVLKTQCPYRHYHHTHLTWTLLRQDFPTVRLRKDLGI